MLFQFVVFNDQKKVLYKTDSASVMSKLILEKRLDGKTLCFNKFRVMVSRQISQLINFTKRFFLWREQVSSGDSGVH